MSNEQSKCTSFVQSAEDLYVLELTELDSIPDPKDHLVGFYLVAPPHTPPTATKNSPEVKSKIPAGSFSSSSGVRTSISISSKKSKIRNSVTRNVRGPHAMKSFIEPMRMERANDMKS